MRGYDDQLDLDPINDIPLVIDEHLPHGIPHYFNHTLCILYQMDYITGYSHDLQMPLWSAYTVVGDEVYKGIGGVFLVRMMQVLG